MPPALITRMERERQIRNLLPRDLKGLLKLWLLGIWVLLLSRAPADPDLWGHVRFGRDLLAAGALTAIDPYSFTSDQPWINHEWLSEALMAAAFDRAGDGVEDPEARRMAEKCRAFEREPPGADWTWAERVGK